MLLILILFAYLSNIYGTSLHEFISLGTSVRADSIGGTAIAITRSPDTINYNPAGIGLVHGIAFNYHTLWLNAPYVSLAYTKPFAKSKGWGVSIFTLDSGDLELRNNSRELKGIYRNTNYLISIGLAEMLTETIRFGINVKSVVEKIDTQILGSGMVDGGFLFHWQAYPKISLSAVLRNLTLFTNSYTYPQTLPEWSVGFGYNIFPAWFWYCIEFVTQGEHTSVRTGTELNFSNLLFLRTGLQSDNGTLAQISLGMGLQFGKKVKYSIDFAYLIFYTLDPTYKVSLSLIF